MITQYRALGAYFGYPRCCADAFEKDYCTVTRMLYEEAPWYGTGYVPCPSCAHEAIQDWPAFVVKNIVPYRLCKSPFPLANFEGAKFLEQLEEQ